MLSKTPTKLLQCSMDQEHKESWRMRISTKPLTVRVKLVLLVFYSVQLHLTALYYFTVLVYAKTTIHLSVGS